MSGKPPAAHSATPTPPPPASGGSQLPADQWIADGLLVKLVTESERTRATVCGEIDLDIADGLRETLERALGGSRTGLDLDLSAVTFCDSAGLNLMLRLRSTAHRAGRTLKITAASTQVEHLLAITETTSLFTAEEALGSPSEGPRHENTDP
ncbi:STAS domain-containing protein [Kitasatospora sp. NPDC048722]|uniref:STAS domain-containing protein n=1 Tax=Kitasatospora sp. NPDC048722 TaxID=3155639 RepID=UPI0033D053A0